MHVLLAIDGSSCADRARDLVARLPWPDGTAIAVVSVVDDVAAFGLPLVVPSEHARLEMEAAINREVESVLESTARVVERPGVTVDARVLHGRAGTAIVEAATALGADLVVVGSRGHSQLASMLLGSTSDEVVDHAPCPVLVVRDSEIDEVVLGADGSPGATHAEAVLGGWPILRGLPVTVAAVAETAIPFNAGMAAGLYDVVIESYVRDVDTARAEAQELADRVAARLQRSGVAAVAHVMEGEASTELVAFAHPRKHPLIVVGSRGQSGIARLLLGSVARNVLHHATGSVLVVRENVTVKREREGAAAPAAAG
ncbi:MAG: universal stress protein [Candidatus Limnocylindrales bacterium]